MLMAHDPGCAASGFKIFVEFKTQVIPYHAAGHLAGRYG